MMATQAVERDSDMSGEPIFDSLCTSAGFWLIIGVGYMMAQGGK